MARITRFALAGLLGALIGWLILEPTSFMPDNANGVSDAAAAVVGMMMGGLIGLGIGLSGSQSGLSSRDGVKTILSGVIFGGSGGIVGLNLGNRIWVLFSGYIDASNPSPLQFLALVFGRSIGWALLGVFIGLSQGIAVMSPRKMVSGLIGGLIGGGTGGLVFQLMASTQMFHPAMVRFVSFAIMGFAIGLFIGIIDEIAKKAWLIKDLGRGEGKEFHLFRPITMLGRDELADVPVYGDPMVAKTHAKIVQKNIGYTIEDLGSSTGTTVNGTRITTQLLKDGDIIHLGTSKFIFRTKGKSRTPSGTPAPKYVPPTALDGPVCPFCGGMKDAQGNCACSVGSAPPPPIQQNQYVAPVSQPISQPTQVIQVQPTSVQQSAARISGVSGAYAGTSFQLINGQVLGREPAREIPLVNDPTVSRSHARVLCENGAWMLEDMGSANGTFVNDERVTRRELRPGDIIRVGNSSFRFDI